MNVRYAFLALSLSLVSVAGCNNPSEPPREYLDVRLGLVPRDVRSRVTIPGTWESRTEGALTVLDVRRNDRGSPESASFEFHNGMLVAVRARLTARDALVANGPVLKQSSTAVWRIEEESTAGMHQLRWIARDCPAHAEEVKKILGAQ
jgi:hypothetical protein